MMARSMSSSVVSATSADLPWRVSFCRLPESFAPTPSSDRLPSLPTVAVFEDTAVKAGVRDRFGILDSCGTGNYHEGEEPDERTIALLKRRNIPYDENNFARGVKPEDFTRFDYIFGMDTNNSSRLQQMQPKGTKAQVRLFGDVDDGKSIADPYYTTTSRGSGRDGFEETYQQVLRYSHSFLKELGLEKKAKA